MPDLRHLLTINAPVNHVFSAVASQGGLQQWWTKETIAEPVEDSIAEFKFGDSFHHKMQIMDIQANERVEWLVKESTKEWVGTRIIFRFHAEGEKTILRFSHLNWLEVTDFFASCNFQWAYYLTSLKMLCEQGKGMPYS